MPGGLSLAAEALTVAAPEHWQTINDVGGGTGQRVSTEANEFLAWCQCPRGVESAADLSGFSELVLDNHHDHELISHDALC